MIRPPNWTMRKRSILQRNSPSIALNCVQGIDYRLEQLANCFEKNGAKLISKVLSANKDFCSQYYLTPSKIQSPSKIAGVIFKDEDCSTPLRTQNKK